jgi:hypothetical protein
MKLTKPERIGASQLISGVRPLVRRRGAIAARLAWLIVIPIAACGSGAPSPRSTLPAADTAKWLKGVEALEVRTPDGTVLHRVTEPGTMHTFASLLPPSEFDDIFSESGPARYFVYFVGPGYSDYYIAFSDTHVRYIPKGAARLRPGQRATILAALGVRAD